MNTLSAVQFSGEELQEFQYAISMCESFGKRPSTNLIMQLGYNYEQASRIMYMWKVYNGQVVLNSENDVIKHLKHMHGRDYKITLQDFKTSTVSSVPMYCIVAGIKVKPFDIYNSTNYKGIQGIYRVIDTSGDKVTVRTQRKPRLKYRQSKKVDGVIEIEAVNDDGSVIVVFHKKVCHLINRYGILASLRNPEMHFGEYTMLAFEGTKIYVYASNLGTSDRVRYSGGTQRIYDYGFNGGNIKNRLDSVAAVIYEQFACVSSYYTNPTDKFLLVPKTREEKARDRLDETGFDADRWGESGGGNGEFKQGSSKREPEWGEDEW